MLTEALAQHFARIALGHVRREYPHKLDHVLAGPEDARLFAWRGARWLMYGMAGSGHGRQQFISQLPAGALPPYDVALWPPIPAAYRRNDTRTGTKLFMSSWAEKVRIHLSSLMPPGVPNVSSSPAKNDT